MGVLPFKWLQAQIKIIGSKITEKVKSRNAELISLDNSKVGIIEHNSHTDFFVVNSVHSKTE